VQLLIARGAKMNVSGDSPFHIAASLGHAEIVSQLLEEGANVDAMDANHKTALFLASERDHREVVRLLLEAGATPATTGFTELHVAAFDAPSVIDLLINAGAEVDARYEDLQTPLYLTSLNDNYLAVRSLLRSRANANAQTIQGYSPLHTSVLRGQKDIIPELLAHGANKMLRTNDGHTAIDLAMRANRRR
jgi:ankyrin repeat protein